jgi:glycosyltransferase involved in cell wall biosynthesis
VLLTTLDALAPTHLVALYPHGSVLRHARRQGWRTLGLFADSFELHPLRLWRRHGRYRGELRRLDWIANHGLKPAPRWRSRACPPPASCHGIGPTAAARTILPPKPPRPGRAWCFAGLISANKGVGDLVRAIALLRAQGQAVRAEIAGRGEVEHFRALAARLGVGDAVHFLGSIPNAEVVARMRAAAVVAVPSHHAYPEGLPLTIYEALSARTRWWFRTIRCLRAIWWMANPRWCTRRAMPPPWPRGSGNCWAIRRCMPRFPPPRPPRGRPCRSRPNGAR